MVDEGVEVVGPLTKGADHDAVDSAKRAKFSLNRTDVARFCPAIVLISPPCFDKVLPVQLT